MAPPLSHRAQPCRASGARHLGLGALACLLAFPLLVAVTPPARGDAAVDPASILERLRDKRQRQEQQQERDFQRLLSEGRSLLAQNAREQARRVLAQAAALKPGDAACARLLAQAEGASAPSEPDRLLDQMKDTQSFKTTALVRQLELSLFEAEKAQKAGDHARAREYAERVVGGAPYVPDAAQAAALRTTAEAVLASSKAAGEKAATAELQNILATEKDRTARGQAVELSSLRERGWRFQDSGESDKALALAQEMLRRDPGNKQAIFLQQEAQRAIDRRGDLATVRKERKELEKEILVEQVEREMTPPKDMPAKVVIPGPRDPKKLDALRERSMEPWEHQFRTRLGQPIDVEFQNATVSEACRYLSQASGCTVMVDPVVARDPKRFTLPRMTMSLEHALHWLCRFGHVRYTLRDHAILVTTRGGVLDEPITKDYDISGLIVPYQAVKTTFSGSTQVVDEGSVRQEMLGAIREAAREAPGGRSVADDALGEGWVQFIRSSIATETWDEPAAGAALQEKARYSIQYRNGRIVIVHTPEVQEQVERLLDDFRKARNLQVHIFSRFILIDMDFLEKMDVDFGVDEVTLGEPTTLGTYGYTNQPANPFLNPAQPITDPWAVVGSLLNNDRVGSIPGGLSDAGALNITYSYLGKKAVNAFVTSILKRRKGSVLMAPRLTCFNTQRANFQAVTNFNYVRRINSDGEPEIGNVPEGIIFDVQPFVSADRRYITLVLQPQMRTLVNRNFQDQSEGFQYAAGIVRIVNLPETVLRSLATTVTVPDGGTLLVGGLAEARERSGEAGVPFIRGIPLLKYLFREWTEAERRESLIILVTAEIVPDIFEE